MVLGHDISKGQRTQDIHISEDVTFPTMLLAPLTIQGLYEAGFHKPSPIQLYGIPVGKCGFDLLLEAKSGTGKTAVFSIIALEKLDFTKGLQVLILTPTREIAAQIYDVLKQIGAKYEALEIAVVMGGLSLQDDIIKFKKDVHIVVGSPGRLKHLIQDKYIDTSAVRLFVLDEADKLMEKTFQADIKYIYSVLPKQKQVIMSSATYTEAAKKFINEFVLNAQHICPNSDSILLGIEQRITIVKYNCNIVRQTLNRYKELLNILTHKQFKQCIVFCNYQARVSEIHKLLKREKWPSDKLYGQQEQTDRLDALKTLQEYQCRVLVSTDLAARGIDASNIDLVINFEPPQDWQSYLHRIGRAGRFGSYGIAVTILTEGKEQQQFLNMLKPMGHSLNIMHLWTNDKLIIEKSPPSIKTEKNVEKVTEKDSILPDKIKSDTIWEDLCSKTREVHVLETFENLCKSIEKIESLNIEALSDLMQEFKDKQSNDDQFSYKHLEIKNPIPSQKKLDNTPQIAENINTSSACSAIENTVKEEDNYEIENTETNNQIKEKLSVVNHESKSYPLENADNTAYDNDNDINNIQSSLLHFGLPTEFSSSKGKVKIQLDHSFQKCSTNKEWSKKSRCHKNVENKKLEIYNDNDAVNNSLFMDPYVPYQRPNKTKYVTASIIDNNADTSTFYNDWYKQLKTKMKQIEMVVYIDELSKL